MTVANRANPNAQKLTAGLYLVATPIGTARDITLRCLDILAAADVLAAEDTRTLRRLMDIHGVALSGRKMIAYHDHNGDKARPEILRAIADGASVAYASEAGTPMIADPGYDLVRAVYDAGGTVTSAPGPNAAITALTLSGLPTDKFFFAGFIANSQTARRKALAEIDEIPGTTVLYESPKRLMKLLGDIAQVLGSDRQICVARELTKKFEEVFKGGVGDVIEMLEGRTVKGEIVVLIAQRQKAETSVEDIEQRLRQLLVDKSVKDAVDLVARETGQKRRLVYQTALGIGKSALDEG